MKKEKKIYKKAKFLKLDEKILKIIEPELEDAVIGLIKDANAIRAKNKISMSSYHLCEPGSESPEYFDWLNRTTKLIAYLNNEIADCLNSEFGAMFDVVEGYSILIGVLAHPCKDGAMEKALDVFYRKDGITIPIVDSRDLKNTWRVEKK